MPWCVRKFHAQRVCWSPLDIATSSTSHEEVVLVFWVVDLVYVAPLPIVVNTPECDLRSWCTPKEASM